MKKEFKNQTNNLEITNQNLLELRNIVNSFINVTSFDEGKTFFFNKMNFTDFNIINYNKSTDSLPLLVVRFSQRNCSSCIENLLSAIKKNIPQKFNNKLTVLTDYSKSIYAKFFIKNNENIPFPFRNLKRTQFNFKSDNANSPFMFVIDKENKIRQVFIHAKEDELRTRHYIKAIVNRYFIKNED